MTARWHVARSSTITAPSFLRIDPCRSNSILSACGVARVIADEAHFTGAYPFTGAYHGRGTAKVTEGSQPHAAAVGDPRRLVHRKPSRCTTGGHCLTACNLEALYVLELSRVAAGNTVVRAYRSTPSMVPPTSSLPCARHAPLHCCPRTAAHSLPRRTCQHPHQDQVQLDNVRAVL